DRLRAADVEVDAAIDAEPRGVEPADRCRQLDLLRMQVLAGELRERLQLSRQRAVQTSVPVAETRRGVPHLQIQVRSAFLVVQVAALRPRKRLGRIEIMNCIAPRTILSFERQQFRFVVLHTPDEIFPASGMARPPLSHRSTVSATVSSVSNGVNGMEACLQK